MRFRTLLLAGTLSCLMASPALADRMWLLPSQTTVGTTHDTVAFDAAITDTLFSADHVALPPEIVTVTRPDGTAGEKLNVTKGRTRSTFDVAIDMPGTWKIGFERTMIGGTFMLNGEEWRVTGHRPGGGGGPGGPGGGEHHDGGSHDGGPQGEHGGQGGPGGPEFHGPMHMVPTPAEIPAGATDIKLFEADARTTTYVTTGEPTKTVFAPTGHGLEFDPVSAPDDLVADEPATFRYLIDGKPAAGIKVEVIPGGAKYRENLQAQTLVTGPDGVVHITWPFAGWYWVQASAEDDHPADAHAQARKMTFTTTLEVVAP